MDTHGTTNQESRTMESIQTMSMVLEHIEGHLESIANSLEIIADFFYKGEKK